MKFTKTKLTLLAPLILAIACLGDAAVETMTVRVHEYVIADKDLPGVFDGFRIAFLTDIHHGPFFSRERIAAVVSRVNGLKPDLALLGGDYVHRGAQYIEPCFRELGKLDASAGVFGVLGNHDHWESAGRTRAAMAGNGIGRLDNSGVWIVRGRERIRVGGAGDFLTDRQDLASAAGSARKDDFVVLVSHNPDYAERLPPGKVDLMLSGHTHGGQVSFFGLYAPLLPTMTGQKFRSGPVETAACRVIVSNGIGTITPPVRFFAPAEIVLVTLRSTKESRR